MKSRWTKALLSCVVALSSAAWLLAVTLPGGATAATTGNDSCSYPSSSFTESTVMRWAQINGTGTNAKIVAYGNDEKGLLLGVNGATPMSSATQNGSNGQTGGASYHVSNASGGSTTATDPSGRVYYPALYITNVTAHPLSANGTGAGDFQNGGTPRNVSGGQPFIDDVFGTWSTATVSGANYTVTPPLDKNDWNLGSNSDAPVGTTFAAMGDEGFGAEVRWNVSHLTDSDGNALQPGNTYRIQIIEHDGDQNKTGGDAGEFCANLSIPGQPGIQVVKKQRIGNTGAFTHDPVFGIVGETVNYQMTVTNTGTISETYTFSDPQCDAGTLAGPTPAVQNNTLSAGQSVVYTCSHVLTGSDKASGFTNAACATTGALQSCDSVLAHVPAISLVKTQRIGSAGSFTHNDVSGNPGDTDNYQMKVTNTGDTSLVLNFTDANCDGGTLSGPSPALANNTLAKGASVLYTCSHVLSSSDAPKFTNTANVVGTAPDGTQVNSRDSVNANVILTPGIQVVKKQRIGNTGAFTHDPVFGKVGDTVNYQMTVTNTGNVAESYSFSDPQCDAGTLAGPTPAVQNNTLSAGQSVVYTCSHVLTAADTASGFTNAACATSGALQSCDTVIAHVPAISLVKTQRIGSAGNFTHNDVTGNPGDTDNYQMKVTNTGDTSLVLNFTDANCDSGTLSGPTVLSGSYSAGTKTLSAGGQLLYTCSHVLSSSDAPRFTNTANVVGTAPDGTQVSAQDSVNANVQLTPGIQVVKKQRIGNTGAFTHDPVFGIVGETVNYQMTVTNTGNVAESYSFSDPQCDAGTLAGPTPAVQNNTLPAGQSVVYTCSHVLTLSDKASGFTNAACATSGALQSCDTVIAHVPAISLVKTQRIGSAGNFTHNDVTGNPGDTDNYQMKVTNTGDTSLVLNFTDANCDGGTLSGPSPALANNTLAKGASVLYTCSHLLSDSDAPRFTNTANVVGTAPDGTQVNSRDSVNANVQLTPGIQVIKKQRIGDSGAFTHDPVFGKVGDTVNYQMTVTNTGNVAESYSFSDPQCDAGTLSGPTPAVANNTLPAGQSVVYTCSHVLTASDKASGFTNAACATSGALQSCDTVISHVPAITLHKVERIGDSSFTHGPVTGNVGDTVDYQMTVTNSGDTTLVIAFTDDQCDSGTLSGPSVLSGVYDAGTKTLSSGGELLYTCSHVLAAGDQPYTNTASVIGTPPAGAPVSATDSVKAFANTPGIRVIKLQRDGTSGAFTSNPITASVGDTVYYEIQTTNTGNVPLTLSLSDPHCDAGTIQGPVSISGSLNGDVLSPGGVAQYTCWHVVTAGDIPQFTNTAVVTGTPPSGPPVHGTGIVVANITQSAIQVLKLEKDANGSGGFTTGPLTVTEQKGHYVVHTIDYEIQVTNTGNTPLALSLDDPRCDAGTIQGPIVISGTLSGKVLSPGGQAQYTCSHRYVKSDSATFVNTATVTGTPPSGLPVHGTSHVTVQRKTVLVKHVCRTPSGRVIHYTGHKKPAACHRHPSRPPKHPRGFTG
jgi:hypothetical protein